MSIRSLVIFIVLVASAVAPAVAIAADENWPQFRGPAASGISPTAGPLEWDVKTPKNVRWKTAVPGLGHSSPVVWGDRIFLTTAVPVEGGDESLKTGLYGDI